MSRFRFHAILVVILIALFLLVIELFTYFGHRRLSSAPRDFYDSTNLLIQTSHKYVTPPNQYLSMLPAWISDTWGDLTGNRFQVSDVIDNRPANCPLNSEEILELKKLKDTHVMRADLKLAENDGALYYLQDCSGVSYVDIANLGASPELSVDLISKLKLVVSLKIFDDRLRDEDIETLVRNPELQVLSINGENLQYRGMSAIAKSKSLRWISIRSGNITGDQFCELLSLSAIELISLLNCTVSDATECATIPAPHLQIVNLGGTSVAVDTLRMLRSASPGISITLSDGDFDSEFAKPIEDLRQVHSLQIIHSRIGDDFLLELESSRGMIVQFIGCEISPNAINRLRQKAKVIEKKSSIEVEF